MASNLISKGYPVGDVSHSELSDLLYKLEKEKQEKNERSDLSIDYNDEIVSIESVGKKETIDISVSGDNLFYCNNILTKNSFGLPATVDFMFALIRTEELDNLGQVMIKQLKSRYGNKNNYEKFVIGIEADKMKLFDVEDTAQNLVQSNGDIGITTEKFNTVSELKF